MHGGNANIMHPACYSQWKKYREEFSCCGASNAFIRKRALYAWKFWRLTVIVQYLFKRKPFVVLHCTNEKQIFLCIVNVLFLHISAIVFD